MDAGSSSTEMRDGLAGAWGTTRGGTALAVRGEDTSSRGVCRDHPARVRKLFAALDLGREGLEAVRGAAEEGDWPAACDELIAYYRGGVSPENLRGEPRPRRAASELPDRARGLLKAADAILEDTFTIQAVTARQPRLAGGGLNWAHNGPLGDREWGWLLNRHSIFSTLLRAWRTGGDPKYARRFDALIRDWVAGCPYSGHRTGSAQWRSLETGLRMRGSWPAVFYGFQGAEEFSPAGRILMLSSIPDHADTCMRLHGGGNHFLMEMMGLASAATYWPEFAESKSWFDFALAGIAPEVQRQVYPDGVQDEMSACYHHVATHNLQDMADLAGRAGREMPAGYVEGLERLWDFVAYSQRPDGAGPLSADSDRVSFRGALQKAAGKYGRPDWAFLASLGEQGQQPEGLPSRVWPDSGQVVMRSGWGREAHWGYFDAGPHGGWHGHYDNLHLSIAAGGRDLLVDSGRYCYKSDRWRDYFKGSAAHNVVLVDGLGQNDSGRGSVLTRHHRVHPAFDYARGDFEGGFDAMAATRHSRAVVYLRGLFWLVFDRVSSNWPRRLEALWHFHPECTVETAGLQTCSTDAGAANLLLAPAGGPDWKLELVRGREEPGIQGWYSSTYNVKEPNTTAVYSAEADAEATFAWGLFPAEGEVPEPVLECLPAPRGAQRVRVTWGQGLCVEVAVRFEGREPVPLSGGLEFDGDCAIIGLQARPLVAGGRVSDGAGRNLASHDYGAARAV